MRVIAQFPDVAMMVPEAAATAPPPAVRRRPDPTSRDRRAGSAPRRTRFPGWTVAALAVATAAVWAFVAAGERSTAQGRRPATRLAAEPPPATAPAEAAPR